MHFYSACLYNDLLRRISNITSSLCCVWLNAKWFHVVSLNIKHIVSVVKLLKHQLSTKTRVMLVCVQSQKWITVGSSPADRTGSSSTFVSLDLNTKKLNDWKLRQEAESLQVSNNNKLCGDGFWEMMFLFVLLLQSLKVTVSEVLNQRKCSLNLLRKQTNDSASHSFSLHPEKIQQDLEFIK